MPTLNWIGKEAVVKHHKEVPFRLLEPVPELSCEKVGAGETDDDRLAFVIRLPGHPLALVPPADSAQVTAQVGTLLERMNGEMTRQAMQDAVGLAHREHFRKTYLAPALEQGVIEMTLPDKPNSRSQRYRLTALGQRWLDTHAPGKNHAN